MSFRSRPSSFPDVFITWVHQRWSRCLETKYPRLILLSEILEGVGPTEAL